MAPVTLNPITVIFQGFESLYIGFQACAMALFGIARYLMAATRRHGYNNSIDGERNQGRSVKSSVHLLYILFIIVFLMVSVVGLFIHILYIFMGQFY